MVPSIISKVLPSSGRPISSLEFKNALLCMRSNNANSLRQGHGWDNGRTGLAISGGVDSMALAALCTKLQNHSEKRSPGSPKLEFRAFVVDHGVRHGSLSEAYSVSEVLEKRGIPTRVLRLDWGKIEDPGQRANFESLARKYRFQALGKACLEDGIQSLFVAHHEDDQAETVMMRMMSDHRVLGLVGMKEVSGIPECYGLHGIGQSGGVDLTSQSQVEKFDYATSMDLKSRGHDRPGPLVIERGGIKVYRPLLPFNKSRLIATCQREDMEWFEDHTNKDPSLTRRNAVRHIFRSATLPTALKPESMILLSERCKKRDRSLNSAAQKIFEESFLSSFNTRTGTLIIRFAHANHISSLNLSQTSADKGIIAALLLRQVVTFVTPDEHVHLYSLHGAVGKIFPEIVGQTSSETVSPTPFTVSGVRFQPLFPQRDKASCRYQKFEWQVSRQPHSSIPSARPLIVVPRSDHGKWSEWALYDGRFWIRVRNCSSFSVVVRPFHKDDMQNFKQTQAGRELLKNYAPELVRWTLPAIAIRDQNSRERVVALPTLDLTATGFERNVNWEVRYKSVDVDSLYARELCIVK